MPEAHKCADDNVEIVLEIIFSAKKNRPNQTIRTKVTTLLKFGYFSVMFLNKFLYLASLELYRTDYKGLMPDKSQK